MVFIERDFEKILEEKYMKNVFVAASKGVLLEKEKEVLRRIHGEDVAINYIYPKDFPNTESLFNFSGISNTLFI